jgi:hypothetical protein
MVSSRSRAGQNRRPDDDRRVQTHFLREVLAQMWVIALVKGRRAAEQPYVDARCSSNASRNSSMLWM